MEELLVGLAKLILQQQLEKNQRLQDAANLTKTLDNLVVLVVDVVRKVIREELDRDKIDGFKSELSRIGGDLSDYSLNLTKPEARPATEDELIEYTKELDKNIVSPIENSSSPFIVMGTIGLYCTAVGLFINTLIAASEFDGLYFTRAQRKAKEAIDHVKDARKRLWLAGITRFSQVSSGFEFTPFKTGREGDREPRCVYHWGYFKDGSFNKVDQFDGSVSKDECVTRFRSGGEQRAEAARNADIDDMFGDVLDSLDGFSEKLFEFTQSDVKDFAGLDENRPSKHFSTELLGIAADAKRFLERRKQWSE